jgi:hypothetical protein
VSNRAFILLGLLVLATASIAGARTKDDCQTQWARSVRSYLTQNRKAGPDGAVPATVDDEELAAQAWEAAFGPACDLEQQGKRKEARVEAALIGAQILSKLDARGCVQFMDAYMQSSRAKDICDVARSGATADVRQKIETSIPPK